MATTDKTRVGGLIGAAARIAAGTLVSMFLLTSLEMAYAAGDAGVAAGRQGSEPRAGGGGGGGGDPTGSGSSEKFDTVVVVDAGSSGCRLNVYQLDGEGESVRFSGIAGGKMEPGLSSFAESPGDAGEYILPLLGKASEIVPPEKHSSTKVFIKSTAGMRLLPLAIQEAIYDDIYADLVGNPSLFPFALERSEVGTLDGEQEAFFAVLSANFLAGRIDARMYPTGHGSGEIGALDMGGASTQIIFRHRGSDENKSEGGTRVPEVLVSSPAAAEAESAAVAAAAAAAKTDAGYDGRRYDRSFGSQQHHPKDSSNDSRRRTLNAAIDDEDEGRNSPRAVEETGSAATLPVSESDFWGTSHLGYGVTEVRSRIWTYLVQRHQHSHAAAGGDTAAERTGGEGQDHHLVQNPCSFVGRVDEWKGHRLVGSGDHVACEEIVAAVLWEQDGDAGSGDGGVCRAGAKQRACGVGGVEMPALSGDFLAMSVFFYATHCLHMLGPAELPLWPTPTLSELRAAAEGFCAMEWAALRDRKEAVGLEDELFHTSEEALPNRCVEVVYMTTLLRDGYGFPEDSRNITYALEADGMEVGVIVCELEWTLGYALTKLAGSRELPPPKADTAAGAAVEMAELSEARPGGTTRGFSSAVVASGEGGGGGVCARGSGGSSGSKERSGGGAGGGTASANHTEPGLLAAAAARVFANLRALWGK